MSTCIYTTAGFVSRIPLWLTGLYCVLFLVRAPCGVVARPQTRLTSAIWVSGFDVCVSAAERKRVYASCVMNATGCDVGFVVGACYGSIVTRAVCI